MRKIWMVAAILLAACAANAQETAPRHEVGLTLGGLLSQSRSGGSTSLNLGSGVSFQANYGYRLFGGDRAALFGEVHFLASPLRDIGSADKSLTRDVATIFLTPGIRVKFRPTSSVSPFVAIGGGWSVYEQSTNTLSGNTNPASRVVTHGAFDYGAGADFRFWRFIGLRAEIRDFFAGAPLYNTASIHGGQHNVVAGGGLVLKFR
jgi:opacity protein-like surface antigen